MCTVRHPFLTLYLASQCVLFYRLSRFAQSKVLSFVPPDGRFTLMDYRYDPIAGSSAPTPAPGATVTAAAASHSTVQVPFTLKALMQTTGYGGTRLLLSSRNAWYR